MNYYEPRELMDKDGNPSGLWHYTCRNDNHIYAVGYCSKWETCPDCKGHSIRVFRHSSAGRSEEIPEVATYQCKTCKNKGVIERGNPCSGHITPDEARKHFHQYILDTARYDGKYDKVTFPCEVCGTQTQGYVGHEMCSDYALCDEHRNREGLDKVLKIGDMITS